ncbi:MAG: thiol:disulfide interchange protein DsbA/DsbL [Shewanella sp.]
MKKILMLLASVCFAQSAYATQSQFTEGVHYDVVASTGTEQPEVMEFFSYLCPNCATFEPIIESLRNALPAGVSVKRSPVEFLGREMGDEMQRAYAVAQLLSVESAITPAMFNQIYGVRQPPQNRDDVRALFVANGVSADAFDGAIESFSVSGMIAQYNRNTQAYKVRGVPAFVVNGKYMVKLGSIKEQAQFNQLVAFLLTKKQ